MDETVHPGHIDWKTVFAGVALSWTVIIGGGALFRASILASVDQRVAEHSIAASVNRQQGLRELEARIDGLSTRISEIEQHCASVRDWRGRVDGDILTLRDWRDRCSQRQERCAAWIESDSKRMDQFEAQIERLKEQIRHQ